MDVCSAPYVSTKRRSAFTGKLDNIQALAAYLNHPEKKFQSIHVGGTNGKGSSSHMLASILQEAGYKVGLYTSPHLKDFRERIRINGQPIEKQKVVNFVEKHLSYLKGNQLSFFEMTVGLAFDHFATEKVDIAIIEVGLGGRLDSTNIITPKVSLITNIGLDHTAVLGNTLSKIAFEKAGIIKEGVPAVISEKQPETTQVFEDAAASKNTKLIFAEQVIQEVYKTDLLGNYQTKNSRGVVATIKALPGFRVTEQHIIAGLQRVVENTGLLGRWQILQHEPITVCDTAHNAEGLRLVLAQLEKQRYINLHIVLGVVNDKDLNAILALFPKSATYYFCRPNISRGLDEDILKTTALKFNLNGNSYASVLSAYNAAVTKADKKDFIFIGGSTFTVAEVV